MAVVVLVVGKVGGNRAAPEREGAPVTTETSTENQGAFRRGGCLEP